jgi:uncharacterized protein (TIGR02001 family)
MNKTLIASAVAAALLIPAGLAMADDAAPAAAPAAEAPPASPLSFNVGLVSDYLFRGISQTHGDPAIQGGVDYAFSNGFYVGAWASNITWVKDYTNKGNVEVDLYGGYKGALANPDWTYQLGVITYNYPGHGDANAFGADPNTTELLVSLGYKWLSVKYSRTVSSHFVGWYSSTGGDTDGSGYLEANASYDLGDGWGIAGHIGHQKVKDFSPADYSDENIGITKDVGFGVIGLMYSHTNAKGKTGEPYSWPNNNFVSGVGSTSGFKNVAKDKAVLSFLKTF